ESSLVDHSSLPDLESNARKRLSAVAPTKTSPPAVAIGPPAPGDPTFLFPSGRASFTPRGTFQAKSPVLASTAIRLDHGGLKHGRFAMVLPAASFKGAERAAAVTRL